MDKIKLYIVEAYNELMHKVSWPTWPELWNSAVVVLVASLIFSLVIWVMDLGSKTAMLEGIYKFLMS